MEQILIGRPCSSASNWKSTAHTTFGASAVGVDPRGSDAFAPPPLGDAEAFLTPELLRMLLIDQSGRTAGPSRREGLRDVVVDASRPSI